MIGDDCQLVILAGGLATRLGDLAADCPKSMVSIFGRPFLEYQIGLARERGLKKILLLTGHLGDQIQNHFGSGTEFGVTLSYSREEKLLGTGGALKLAADKLSDTFLVMYGDAFLETDYNELWNEFNSCKTQAMMTVYKNSNRWGPSNLAYSDGRVTEFSENPESSAALYEYIDFGLTAARKDILELIPDGREYSLNAVFAELARSGQLLGHEVFQRFYEIGSISGLSDLKDHLAENQVR